MRQIKPIIELDHEPPPQARLPASSGRRYKWRRKSSSRNPLQASVLVEEGVQNKNLHVFGRAALLRRPTFQAGARSAEDVIYRGQARLSGPAQFLRPGAARRSRAGRRIWGWIRGIFLT